MAGLPGAIARGAAVERDRHDEVVGGSPEDLRSAGPTVRTALGSPGLVGPATPAEVPRQQAVATVADLVLAGLYIPAAEGPEPVAGDFFEVLPLGEDLVAVVLGDIAGHGSAALAAMRRLRSTARSYALDLRGPASVLGRLDALLEEGDTEEFATLWYGEYRPSTGELTYAAAGHPPPALYVHGGVRVLAEADAPALGTGLAHTSPTEHVATLPSGAVLVAYSDGLIERRGADFDDQLALLTGVVQRACDPGRAGTPESIAVEILDALIPDPDGAEDDVCLLVIRRQP